jgi:hypothetical protein
MNPLRSSAVSLHMPSVEARLNMAAGADCLTSDPPDGGSSGNLCGLAVAYQGRESSSNAVKPLSA